MFISKSGLLKIDYGTMCIWVTKDYHGYFELCLRDEHKVHSTDLNPEYRTFPLSRAGTVSKSVSR